MFGKYYSAKKFSLRYMSSLLYIQLGIFRSKKNVMNFITQIFNDILTKWFLGLKPIKCDVTKNLRINV